MFLIIINQIIKMLLILLLGVLCYRLKLIDQHGNKVLANLLLMVVNPVLAVVTLQVDFSMKLARGLLLTYVLSFIVHGAGVVLTTIFIKKDSGENSGLERFGAMYSNCGFIGIPLVQSVLGAEGVLYLTAILTTFNLFSWTHGVTIITGNKSNDWKKGLLSPMVIASLLGVLLFFLQIRLPETLKDTMEYISAMNTPLAMIVAGVSVAQTDIRKMLGNKRIYIVAAAKLLIMPTLTFLFLSVIRVNPVVACTVLITSACPIAASETAFALRFQKDYKYASELYTFTTVASLLTIPIFMFAAERILL